MGAKDLMIGDWVYNKNIDKPMQVYPMMLPQMFRRTPDARCEEDYNIFPIPLTPEILEKNGWVNQHFGTQRQEWWLDKTKFPIVRYSVNDTLHHNGIVLKFVHQLQHALRLCGIDKEIEL